MPDLPRSLNWYNMPTRHERIDASGKPLGRLASTVAAILRGKDRADFDPRVTPPVHVTVLNASKIRFSGKKLEQKRYYHFSGYPGGLRARGLRELFASHPDRVVRMAVAGMLPDNKLKKRLIAKLNVQP